jgi:hypothetical protein
MKKKNKIYAYYDRKGKVKVGTDVEFLIMSFFLFAIVPIVALFEFIWLKISGKGKWITKKEYYETKLREINNAK